MKFINVYKFIIKKLTQQPNYWQRWQRNLGLYCKFDITLHVTVLRFTISRSAVG